jgi:hypothetical protein
MTTPAHSSMAGTASWRAMTAAAMLRLKLCRPTLGEALARARVTE